VERGGQRLVERVISRAETRSYANHADRKCSSIVTVTLGVEMRVGAQTGLPKKRYALPETAAPMQRLLGATTKGHAALERDSRAVPFAARGTDHSGELVWKFQGLPRLRPHR